MKLAVVTIAIGDDYQNIAKLTHPLLENYAKKIGADFIVIDKPKLSIEMPHYEKFQIFNLLLQYHRVIYIDTDIVVRHDCPNLFDIVPENKIGVFNEGRIMDRAAALNSACEEYNIKLNDWDGTYYNTGVMVISRVHRELFVKPEKEIWNFFEQSYINACFLSSYAPIYELPYQYNRMHCMDPLTGEHRLMSYIIHYAGVLNNRFEIIANDIKRLAFGEQKTMKKNVSIQSGTRKIGDTVCTEPIARYIIENSKNTDFTIVTNHPCVFKHLADKAKIMTFDEFNPPRDVPFFDVLTCIPEKNPTRKIFNSDKMHVIDYMSIACMNRVLLPKEKVIKLEVSTKGLSQILDNVRGEFILVHPGKSWPSKTFPPSYWNKIISSLATGPKKVVVVGRQFYDTGVVDVEIPDGVVDLRDLLDLEGLIAAVSMCSVLVTNDSGPLHIAGAFPEVKVVLIPSCKHPVHILPWREGPDGPSQSHNMKTLYKKLVENEACLDVTNLTKYSLKEVTDIESYLPEATDVVEAALSF